jgi:hypothetical protein
MLLEYIESNTDRSIEMSEREREVIVAILRRDVTDLEPAEKVGIQQKFPGRKVVFKRIDPKDYIECDRMCQELGPSLAAVILPLDRPIPALAMQRGVPFVVITKGDVRRLKPLNPEFEEFVPKLD